MNLFVKLMANLNNISLKFFYCIPLLIIVLSCNKDTVSYDHHFGIYITDTIKVKYIARGLQIIDRNRLNGNLLIASTLDPDTLLQSDSTGKIISKMRVKGEGNSEVGNLFNVGYLGDTAILISSNRGFFFYNLSGKLTKFLRESTPIKSMGTDVFHPKIREILTDSGLVVALQLKNSLSSNQINDFFTQNSYKNYRPVTLYNLQTKRYLTLFGYEPNSLFYKEEYNYGDANCYFDYNNHTNSFYVIHDPDPKLYTYNTKFDLTKEIDLAPEHFVLPIKFNKRTSVGSYDNMYVNSAVVDINSWRNTNFITYRTGLPFDEFRKAKTQDDLPVLWKKYMKYYIIICQNGLKAANDIALPYGATGICTVIDEKNVILETNPSITETDNSTIFYRASIRSVSQPQ